MGYVHLGETACCVYPCYPLLRKCSWCALPISVIMLVRRRIDHGLGKSLYEARKKSGLSQEQVAEQLGISRQTVSKWELDIPTF